MSDAPKTTLTDGTPVTADHREIDPRTGMQKGYVVLSDEERAKGFVRPVRDSWVQIKERSGAELVEWIVLQMQEAHNAAN